MMPKVLFVSLVYLFGRAWVIVKLSGYWQEEGLLWTLGWPDQEAQLPLVYAKQHQTYRYHLKDNNLDLLHNCTEKAVLCSDWMTLKPHCISSSSSGNTYKQFVNLENLEQLIWPLNSSVFSNHKTGMVINPTS